MRGSVRAVRRFGRGWARFPHDVIVLALAVGAWGCSPSDPSVIPLGVWGREVAFVECARIFGCCDSAEAAQLGYADEAQCRQQLGGRLQSEATSTVTQAPVRYDGRAARRCLDEVNALSCSAFFWLGEPALAGPSCEQAFVGTLKIGEACEDLSFFCESGNCPAGFCAPAGACDRVVCDPGQFCESTTGVCVPAKEQGVACSPSFGECLSPLICNGGTCGPRLLDGSGCQDSSHCASGACDLTAGVATCVPPFPDGAACYASSQCASGGCRREGTAQTVCGAPFCVGG